MADEYVCGLSDLELHSIIVFSFTLPPGDLIIGWALSCCDVSCSCEGIQMKWLNKST